MKRLQRLEIWFLISFLLLLFIIYSETFGSLSSVFLPSLTDEYRYFGDAQSVAQNGFIGSAFLLEDQVSGIGNFGSHGFAYGWLNGFILRILNGNPLSMPITHLCYLALSLLLIFVNKSFSWIEKLQFSGLLFSFFSVLIFPFSYMQESIQVLFSVLIGFSFLKIYSKKQTYNNKNIFLSKGVIVFVLLIFIASIFRINWAFWLIGLFPLCKGKKQKIIFLLSYGILMFLLLLIFKLIYATYVLGFFYQFSQKLQTASFGEILSFFLQHSADNLKYYFRFFYFEKHAPYYYYGKILLLVFGFFFFWKEKKNSETILQAMAWIILVNFWVLILLYDAYDWREIRSLAPLLYVGLLLVVSKLPKFIYVFLFLQIMMLPQIIPYLKQYIGKHQAVARLYKENTSTVKAFQNLSEHFKKATPVTVILSSDFIKDDTILPLLLPFRNTENQAIRYSMHFGDSIIVQPHFADYVLSETTLEFPHGKAKLLINNGYYYLYEVSF